MTKRRVSVITDQNLGRHEDFWMLYQNGFEDVVI